jgi:intraflagellar transport protein 80
MHAGHGHLLVATASQCHIYATSSWGTPHIFDLKHPASLLLQSERCFALLDPGQGLQLFTYEGRHICTPRAPGQRYIGLVRTCV